MTDTIAERSTTHPETIHAASAADSLYPHFASVYRSGMTAGVAIGKRIGREQVFQHLEIALTAAPLCQLDGADILALVGQRDRSQRLRHLIDRAREQWWRREDARQQRTLDTANDDVDAARAALNAAISDAERDTAMRLWAAYRGDTTRAPRDHDWNDLPLDEARRWAATAREALQ